jgi:hypothetical protein
VHRAISQEIPKDLSMERDLQIEQRL